MHLLYGEGRLLSVCCTHTRAPAWLSSPPQAPTPQCGAVALTAAMDSTSAAMASNWAALVA